MGAELRTSVSNLGRNISKEIISLKNETSQEIRETKSEVKNELKKKVSNLEETIFRMIVGLRKESHQNMSKRKEIPKDSLEKTERQSGISERESYCQENTTMKIAELKNTTRRNYDNIMTKLNSYTSFFASMNIENLKLTKKDISEKMNTINSSLHAKAEGFGRDVNKTISNFRSNITEKLDAIKEETSARFILQEIDLLDKLEVTKIKLSNKMESLNASLGDKVETSLRRVRSAVSKLEKNIKQDRMKNIIRHDDIVKVSEAIAVKIVEHYIGQTDYSMELKNLSLNVDSMKNALSKTKSELLSVP